MYRRSMICYRGLRGRNPYCVTPLGIVTNATKFDIKKTYIFYMILIKDDFYIKNIVFNKIYNFLV
jgi:hypothetical protein